MKSILLYLKLRLMVDYTVRSVNYEFVAVFVGTKFGAEDI